MSKIQISKELLENIIHELTFLTGLKATDNPNIPITGYVSLKVDDLIELNYSDLIIKIEKEAEIE